MPGSAEGSMRIIGREFLCNIYVNNLAVGPTAGFVVNNNGTPTQTGGQLYLLPTNSFYIPPPLLTFARLFQRYRLNGVRFEYATSIGTAQNTSFVMGFAADPGYPESCGATGPNFYVARPIVDQLPQCVKIPAWCESCMIDATITKEWKYLRGDEFNSQYSFANTADDRMSYFGVLLVSLASIDSSIAVAATQTVGDLYMHYDIELVDLSLVQSNPTTFLSDDHKTKEVEPPRSESRSRKVKA